MWHRIHPLAGSLLIKVGSPSGHLWIFIVCHLCIYVNSDGIQWAGLDIVGSEGASAFSPLFWAFLPAKSD